MPIADFGGRLFAEAAASYLNPQSAIRNPQSFRSSEARA